MLVVHTSCGTSDRWFQCDAFVLQDLLWKAFQQSAFTAFSTGNAFSSCQDIFKVILFVLTQSRTAYNWTSYTLVKSWRHIWWTCLIILQTQIMSRSDIILVRLQVVMNFKSYFNCHRASLLTLPHTLFPLSFNGNSGPQYQPIFFCQARLLSFIFPSPEAVGCCWLQVLAVLVLHAGVLPGKWLKLKTSWMWLFEKLSLILSPFYSSTKIQNLSFYL